MPGLGALGLAAPWFLLAGLILPLIWWLLRVTPPAPRLVAFPPIRFVLGLRSPEESPARTPLWLIVLRSLIALLVILALAGPVINPSEGLRGSGPLILIVDNGWPSARGWEQRVAAWNEVLDRAERENRPVRLATTAGGIGGGPVGFSDPLRAEEARDILRAVEPAPWAADHRALLAAAEELSVDGSAHVVWFGDGIETGGTRDLARRMQRHGGLDVVSDSPGSTAMLLRAGGSDPGGIEAVVERADDRAPAARWVRAIAEDGRVLARERAAFETGERQSGVRFALPPRLRNEIARIEIEDENTAGGIFLLDERWRRRPVGLVSGDTSETDQPLLSALYYLQRALEPFSEVTRGTLGELVAQPFSVIVLADIGRLGGEQTEGLTRWIERGGVAVRFSGPKLARNADTLLPVKLRSGGRVLGGALSWTAPARLAPFGEASPFFGLEIPHDIRVRRQVLAEPSLQLNEKTWARLSDGTPLITAERNGLGWIVLVHVTANTEWSNLPISGLFVDLLRRIVDLSQGVIGEDSRTSLPALQTLDGFGALGDPPALAGAIPTRAVAEPAPGPATPPGYYGTDTARRALNLADGVRSLAALGPLPAGVNRTGYRASGAAFSLAPWLLLAALLLAIADTAIGLAMRGLIRLRAARPAAGVAATAMLALALLVHGGPADAQTAGAAARSGPDARALHATLETRLAYVITGDRSSDEISRAGLAGLTRVLRQRTSVEPADPLGVDVERDELAFFPLLYWAVSTRHPPPSERGLEKLNRYLRSGGTILFDTRERGEFLSGAFGGDGAAGQHLRRLLRGLDISTLIPVPPDHVLTKAFYLLGDFPGRWAGGRVWVERRGGRHNDGVSSVIIGANDWSGAWAVDRLGAAMFPVVPQGELQREMAYRFGVNWVMYALTGNYKTDQVHVPAIIERLGQ